MSAVVLAAGVTSTFAWFTTQAQATFTSGTLTVNAPSTIKVSAYDLSPDAPEGKAIAAGTSIPGHAHTLGSVSSQIGKEFFAPKALAASYDANTVYAKLGTTSSVTNAYTGYMKYNLAVTAAKGESGKLLKITVGLGTPAPTGTLLTDYRVALYLVSVDDTVENDHTAASTSDTLDPLGGASPKYQYVFGNAEGSDSAVSSILTPSDGGKATFTARGVTALSDGDANPKTLTADVFQTSVSKHVTAHFVLAAWLEGSARTQQNDAGGSQLKVTATFDLVASA